MRPTSLLVLSLLIFSCDGDSDPIDLTPVPTSPGVANSTGGMPGPPPPMSAMPPNPGFEIEAPSGPVPVTWTVPDSWVATPPSSPMRVAQWTVPGTTEEAAAECALSTLRGGGSVEQNFQRWTSQFEQPDGSSSTQHAIPSLVQVGGLNVSSLEVTGTYITNHPPMSGNIVHLPDWALYGAIVEIAQDKVFLKCLGPASTIAIQHGSIEAFVGSFVPRD